MFGFTWIDSGRYNFRDRKFFRLLSQGRTRDDICQLMDISMQTYYRTFNKLKDWVDTDFRKYGWKKAKYPQFFIIDIEPQPVEQEDILEIKSLKQLQNLYQEKYNTLPNRYKNDKERLKAKLT